MSSKWDQKYRDDPSPYQKPIAFVEECIAALVPGCALDVACGPGRHALALARCGWSVDAVDDSHVACEMVRAAGDAAIHVIQADLESREFAIAPESYDLIVVCCYLQRDLFAAIREGLRPGGHALMVIPMVDNRPDVRPMRPEFLLRDGELRTYFDEWEMVRYFEGIPTDAHRKQVQMLARKPATSNASQTTPALT
jgi:SAM-dependent methyltransferase